MQLQGHGPMRVAALILSLVALASCSTLPTAPASSSHDLIITRAPDDETPLPSNVSLVGSKLINGRVGGVVFVGNWKLIVPPGAFNGIGNITIAVPDSTVDQCDLSIDPPALNHFSEDVELRFRCVSLTDADRRDMRWWNPTSNTWTVLKSWPNKSDLSRCTSLQHFSKYASGKAGW